MNCKICGLEHTSSWTCAQAQANLEEWAVPRETVEIPTVQKLDEGFTREEIINTILNANEIVAEKQQKFDRSAKMKEWWRQRRAKG